MKKTGPEILVVQLAKLGDFLQSTPLLAGLAARETGSRITVLVDRGLAELVQGQPQIHEIVTVDLGELRRISRSRQSSGEQLAALDRHLDSLSRRRFDRIINLNTSRIAALLAILPQADERTGPLLGADRETLIPPPWGELAMNLMATGQRNLIRFNLVDLWASMAGLDHRITDRPIYVPTQGNIRPELLHPLPAVNGLVGLQLGSRHPSRQWPPEYFARLTRALIHDERIGVVLLGAASEADLGRSLMEFLAAEAPDCQDRVINLLGRTSIPDLALVLKSLDLLVTTDTGPMHLAAAMNRPILALFIGPAQAHETGPYGQGHVILQAAPACAPCIEGQANCEDWPCRSMIQPDTVQQVIHWMRGSKGNGPPGDLGPHVRLLVSHLDRFGVNLRPTDSPLLNRREALALAWREAGRAWLRPGYRSDPHDLLEECSFYQPRNDEPAKLAKDLDRWRESWPFPPAERPLDLTALERLLDRWRMTGNETQGLDFLTNMTRAATLASSSETTIAKETRGI